MKAILSRLFDHAQLNRQEADGILTEIAEGRHNPVQVASFITAFQMRPPTVQELEGFRDALLRLAVPFELDGQETIDLVGTGGDNKNTFNISTLAAVVVAGAGYKVTKHGSNGVSSSVGSSNVLAALGYRFTNDAGILRRQLEQAGICFLHAPLFHPALKEVAPIRQQMGMKTIFNLLGPLVNPAQPTHNLLGASGLDVSRLYQYVMQETGRRFAIIHSLDGYDEISLTGPFKVFQNSGEYTLRPEDIGMARVHPDALFGGHSDIDAAGIFKAVLENRGAPVQIQVVCANAGMAIHCLRPERSLAACIAEARESLISGRAAQVLARVLG
jgi:anthranilate phosphoribosyltransferase